MARINLLPWRADRRKQRQKEFMTMLAGAVFAGIALVLLGSFYYDGQIERQTERNSILKTHITEVEGQIKEIEELEARKASLLQRKQVIESLQADRSQNVRLFEELVRTIPDGVRLVTIKQNGSELAFTGRTQSESRVSAYMRNLEVSGLINKPKLSIIEARGEDRTLPFEFEMKVTLRPSDGSDAEGGESDGDVPSETPSNTPPAKTA
jgi:type IV pilus assembly protein PilN